MEKRKTNRKKNSKKTNRKWLTSTEKTKCQKLRKHTHTKATHMHTHSPHLFDISEGKCLGISSNKLTLLGMCIMCVCVCVLAWPFYCLNIQRVAQRTQASQRIGRRTNKPKWDLYVATQWKCPFIASEKSKSKRKHMYNVTKHTRSVMAA